jgi:DNA repair protein RecO (recombination protein O)
MSHTFRTESIVIKKEPWREFDRLYTLYTRRAGKLKVMAKGSRRFQSKLAAHLEPFLLTDVMIARGRQFDKLAGSDGLTIFSRLGRDLNKIALLNYCFEILDELTGFGQADERIFHLAREMLALADENHLSPEKSVLAAKIFILKLLGYLGYEPELSRCLECRKDVGGSEVFFNPCRGGLLCPACAKGAKNQAIGQTAISGTAVEFLRLAGRSDLEHILKIDLDLQTQKIIDQTIDEFLKHHLERELKSEAYWRQGLAEI